MSGDNRIDAEGIGENMLSEIQYDEIIELISLKQEGSHWDFKKEWYGESKNADLLHDIICMANNLDNRDAFRSFILYKANYCTLTFVVKMYEKYPLSR